MAAPNNYAIVEGVAGTRNWQMHTHEGLAQFTEAVVQALHKHDPRWGHLRKNPGQTQINGRAEDAALYLEDTGLSQAIDFVAGANTSAARPAWQPDTPRYGKADWIDPDGGTYVPVPHPGGTTPVPPPAPKPDPIPPYPDEPTFWAQHEKDVVAAYASVGRTIDSQSFRWFTRVMYDIVAKRMKPEEAAALHLAELKRQLGA
jgi:hypothetical protein